MFTLPQVFFKYFAISTTWFLHSWNIGRKWVKQNQLLLNENNIYMQTDSVFLQEHCLWTRQLTFTQVYPRGKLKQNITNPDVYMIALQNLEVKNQLTQFRNMSIPITR